ncbi:MAG: phosphate acetyltransferase [Arachnia sp.]
MTKSVYIASSEWQVSKSAIALSIVELFGRQVEKVGVFRPLVANTESDRVTRAMVAQKAVIQESPAAAVGVSYDEFAEDPDAALDKIVAKYSWLAEQCDAVVIVGSDYTGISISAELDHNALIAANLNAPILFVVRGEDRTPEQIRWTAEEGIETLEARHNTIVSIMVTRSNPLELDQIAATLRAWRDVPVSALPFDDVIAAPSVRQLFEAVDAAMWLGNEDFQDNESLHTLVAGMTLPNLLNHLQRESTVVVPADRLDLLPGLVMAHRSSAYGPLASVILSGGFEIPETMQTLLAGSEVDLPVARCDGDTFGTAVKLQGARGISTSSARKVEVSRALFAKHVDEEALLAAIDLPRAEIRTPTMLEYQLMTMARNQPKRIVLPEATDDRILRAAAIVLNRGVAELILLGDADQITRRTSELGITLAGATIINPKDPELLDKFASTYAELRAHKGMTLDAAYDRLSNLSYFGTMMVHLGMADGMVSGAVNTTADTIRPSLEFVKTKPGVSVVSGAFLMAMSDRVHVYADCAVNPDPTAEQLADIAISSAATAAAFDIEPRVAMLSYSTGESGFGADVDKVRAATELVRQRQPELKVEGPIQFDAAVDMVVAKKKMPGSQVAGQATVFIVPDLNTGNNTYKAVQRTSGAIAIGPVLQGLKKPVNDLSRGALVEDIVSTITITAIQAQND